MFLSNEQKKKLAFARNNTSVFNRAFLPERFEIPDSIIHKKIYSLLDAYQNEKYLAIIAPRGIGKSTIFLGYILKEIAYRRRNFILLGAKTARQAVRDSEEIKLELVHNERLKAVFSNFKPEGRKTPFSKEVWATPPLLNKDGSVGHSGTMVMPTSWTQEIRGIKHGRFRPDLCVIDDLEGTEGVMSEEQRAKLMDWFSTDLLNVVQHSRTKSSNEFDFRIIVIGTLLHEDSLMANLQNKERFPQFKCVSLAICDEDLNSLWTEFMSTEDIKKRYDEYNNLARLDKFALEYLGKVQIDTDAVFQGKHFQYYDEKDIKDKRIENIVLVDVAKSGSRRAAQSALVCWGFDGRFLYLRDTEAGKFTPDDLIERCFNMADRWNAKVLGVEKTGLEDFIIHPIRTLMLKRGSTFELVPLTATGKKADRIQNGLAPFYRGGLVYHRREVSRALEMSLLSFPYSSDWDLMDAASYIAQLLEKGERYFYFDESNTIGVTDQVDFNKRFNDVQKCCDKPLLVNAL